MSLTGKNIIVGVTGGIAAYKTATLVRLLVKAGAQVQVVMTPAAREFITPLTLSTLSGRPVISEFFTRNTGEWHSHVDLGEWAHAMIVAPATASTIGKMASGVADNMLVTTYLSMRCPVFVAPAMDLMMMQHPSTQRNLDTLRSWGNIIIEPTSGELASHLVGKGRMEEPEHIAARVAAYLEHPEQDLTGRRVLITAGPTLERIDPVRYISNFSSGKMGFALAEACASRGAQVTLVAGPVHVPLHDSRITRIDVESAVQMRDEAVKAFAQSDIAIMCAAVADYRPQQVAESKIKREHDQSPTLILTSNPDIARTLGDAKREGQLLVGFALETDNETINAQAKLAAKHLDMIVLNSLRDKGAGFMSDTNKVTIFTPHGEPEQLQLKAKQDVAHDIINAIVKLL